MSTACLIVPLTKLICLDLSVAEAKQRFVSLHETGHGYLPWQRDLYALLEDGDSALDPEAEEDFERQANVFASEVLFQLDSFGTEARSCAFTIKTPISFCDKVRSFGADPSPATFGRDISHQAASSAAMTSRNGGKAIATVSQTNLAATSS